MWDSKSFMLQPRAALDPAAAAPTTPVWLPSGATTYADFVAGNYYDAGAVQASSYFVASGNINATFGLYGDIGWTTAADAAYCATNTVFYLEINDNGYTGVDVGAFARLPTAGGGINWNAGSVGDASIYSDDDSPHSINLGTGHWVASGLNKWAYRHTTTDRAVSVNGTTSSGSSVNPTLSDFHFESNWCARYGGTPLGYIKKIIVFGNLNDAALTTLTT